MIFSYIFDARMVNEGLCAQLYSAVFCLAAVFCLDRLLPLYVMAITMQSLACPPTDNLHYYSCSRVCMILWHTFMNVACCTAVGQCFELGSERDQGFSRQGYSLDCPPAPPPPAPPPPAAAAVAAT
eukprot:COSAG05_NODE_1178_length_5608_cov_7.099474_2_plen_126_part_00